MKGALVKLRRDSIVAPAGSICLFLKEDIESYHLRLYRILYKDKVVTVQSYRLFSEWFEIIQDA